MSDDELDEILAQHWDMVSPEPGVWACDCTYPLGDSSGDLEGRHRLHVAERVGQQVRRLTALRPERSEA